MLVGNRGLSSSSSYSAIWFESKGPSSEKGSAETDWGGIGCVGHVPRDVRLVPASLRAIGDMAPPAGFRKSLSCSPINATRFPRHPEQGPIFLSDGGPTNARWSHRPTQFRVPVLSKAICRRFMTLAAIWDRPDGVPSCLGRDHRVEYRFRCCTTLSARQDLVLP